jgi:beta-glucosidase
MQGIMAQVEHLNRLWSCENSDIQNGIVRNLWGFRSFVTSGWGAIHSPLTITKGVDLEMPGRVRWC